MRKNRLQAFDSADGLRRLLLTRGSATVDEVASALGISRASYYRLVEMFVTRLYGSKESSPQQRPETTPPWFQENLLALTEAHPKWGCYKLAAALSATKKISGPTIQKALARFGLDTQEKRLARKEHVLLSNKNQFLGLSALERRSLIKNNPCLGDIELLRGCRPDLEMFAANVLEVGPQAGDQHRYLLVLVSLHTHVVHLEGWAAGKFSSAVVAEGEELAKKGIATGKAQHRKAYLIMQSNSRSHFIRLESRLRAQSTKLVPKSEIPAALRMINKIIIKEVMAHYVDTLGRDGETAATDYLYQWMVAHNHRPRLGFPTFGKSPIEARNFLDI